MHTHTIDHTCVHTCIANEAEMSQSLPQQTNHHVYIQCRAWGGNRLTWSDLVYQKVKVVYKQ